MIASYTRGLTKCRTPVATNNVPRTRGIRMSMPRVSALLDRDLEHGGPGAAAARVTRPARDELGGARDPEGRGEAPAVGAGGHDLLAPVGRAGLAGGDDDRLAALRPLQRAVDGDLAAGLLEGLLRELLLLGREAQRGLAAGVAAGRRGEQAAPHAVARGGRGGERVGADRRRADHALGAGEGAGG